MNKKVLIIDNEKNVANSLHRLFYNEGCEVDTAYSFDEGKNALIRSDFDIVISDFNLGSKEGIELLEYSKEKNPKGARILISAEVDRTPFFLSEGRKKGFRLVLKPWNDDYLLATVQEAIEAATTI